MHRHFEDDIQALKKALVTMGAHVEQSIDIATRALVERNPALLAEVFTLEDQINKEHIKVDADCVALLAKQALVATDLRLVIAMIKMNTDLERMGDQAVNIAHNAREYLEEPPLKPLQDLPRMAHEARVMVHEALEAFTKSDLTIAKQVLDRDDTVDGLKHHIFNEVSLIMSKQSDSIKRGLALILIARNLERLGDHATNIAEDVIYASTGRDVRHQGARGDS